MESLPGSKNIKFHHNNGPSIFSTAYSESLIHESFATDVIIKAGPEKYEFPCHRLVLAASSDFLRSIISTATPGTTPVILLPDIDVFVVEIVLRYLYYGEVCVSAAQYSEFVEACRLLELKSPVDNVEAVEVEKKETEEGEIWKEEMEEEREKSETEIDMKMDTTIKRKGPRKKFSYLSKINVTPELASATEHRLILAVQRAYTSMGIPITNHIERNIRNSKVVVEDDILVRGVTSCGLCDPNDMKTVCLRYKVFTTGTGCVTFLLDSLKLHIKKQHKSHPYLKG